MDKELLALLDQARSMGANETQLQGVVDSYNAKKKVPAASPSGSLNGQSESQSTQTTSQNPYDNQNPIDLANQSIQLSQKTIPEQQPSPTIGVGLAPTGSGAITQIPDIESQKKANDIDAYLKNQGYDPNLVKKAAQMPSDYYDAMGTTQDNLLSEIKSNPTKAQIDISSANWQVPLQKEILQKEGNNGLVDFQNLRDALNDANSTYAQKRMLAPKILETIRKYAPDSGTMNKWIADFTNYAAPAYGLANDTDPTLQQEITKYPYLDANQARALDFLQDTQPDKAQTYKTALIDPNLLSNNYDAKTAQEERLMRLENIGLSLKENALKSQDQSNGADPNLIGQLANIQYQRNDLPLKYPEAGVNDAENMAQEVLGQKNTGLNWFALKTGQETSGAANSIWDLVSEPFRSDINSKIHQLSAAGDLSNTETETGLTQKNQLSQTFTPTFSPQLQKYIDQIKNDDTMTYQQKSDALTKQFMKDPSQWSRTPIEGGKTNVGLTSMLYGTGELGATLAPYVLAETATGGGATASFGRKFVSSFVSMMGTSFHDAYAQASKNGDPNPYFSALTNTAINSAAMAGAQTPEQIRELVSGTKTAASDLVGKMTDDQILQALRNEPASMGTFRKVFNIGKNVVSNVGNSALEGVKSAAKITPFLTAGSLATDMINGDIKDPQDYLKQAALEGLKFSVLGTGLGMAGKLSESPSDISKAALFQSAIDPEGFLDALSQKEKMGTISSNDANQIRNNIQKASGVLSTVPMLDAKGNPLGEKDMRNLLFLKMQENDLESNMSKDIPKPLQDIIQSRLANTQDKIDKLYKGTLIDEPNQKTTPLPVPETETGATNEGTNKNQQPASQAEIIPNHQNITPQDNLRTMDMGAKEGKKETPEERQTMKDNFSNGDVPMGGDGSGETGKQFIGRVISQFEDLKNTKPDNTTIVTHSSVLKAIKTWENPDTWSGTEKPTDPNNLTPEQWKAFSDNYNKESTDNGDLETFPSANGTIHVVRHGETQDNAEHNFRSANTNLTDKGKQQATDVGNQLKEITDGQIPEIISSNLPRAVDTSNRIMDAMKGNEAEPSPSQVEGNEKYKSKFPVPENPIHEMNSEELNKYADQVRSHNKGLEEEFFGKEGAKKYREAQSISNNYLIHSSDPRYKEANALIDKMENSLTPEQQDEFYGTNAPKGLIYDDTEIRDIARKVGFVEQSENIDDLATSVKNALSGFKKDNPSNEKLAILNAAKKRAIELKIDPKDLIKKVLEKVGGQYKDIEDAEFMMKNAYENLTKKEEQKNISSPIKTEQDGKTSNAPDQTEGRQEIETKTGADNKTAPVSDVEINPKQTEETESGQSEGGRKVGVSHARLTDLANELGLNEPQRGAFEKGEDIANRGRKLLEAGANPDEVTNNKNDLTDRIAIGRAHLEDLVKNADHIAKDKGINSSEYADAIKEVDDYTQKVKELGTSAGQALSSLKGTRDLNTGSFTEVKSKYQENKGSALSKEETDKIKSLTDENEQLRKRAEDAESKLIDATDKELGTENKGAKPQGKFEKQFKDIADKFRKLKQKPIKFTGSDGKEYDVSKMGLGWNDLVELGAKTIEKTGKVADGVAAIIDKIKDTDFFNGMPLEVQNEFKDKIGQTLQDSTPEGKNIKRLEQKLSDLRAGKIPELKTKRQISDREKELLSQIAQEKENLGLGEKVSAPITHYTKNEIQDKLNGIIDMVADKGPSDKKFTPEQAKAIWDYAKSEYLQKGVPYRDMISKVSNDTGLTFDQVNSAITSPKVKRISDEMWKAQADLRKSQNKTSSFVENASQSKLNKIIHFVPDVFRATSVFGHGGIFVGTHAGMTFFDLPRMKHTIKAFFNAWKFAYGDKANYERQMQALRDSPNYILAQRAGLQNDINEVNSDDYAKFQKVFSKIGGEAGIKGFNAIKVLRQQLFNSEFQRLSPELKADPEVAKSISHLINNATGATNIDIPKLRTKNGQVLADPERMFFALGMEASRWEKLTSNPAKATKTAIKSIFYPNDVSNSDKVFAKVWSKRVGWQLASYASILGVNYALQNILNPKNPVNLTNPLKYDFLKFKVGNENVDMTSGMESAVRFTADLGHGAIVSQKSLKGDTRLQAFGKTSATYLRGKLSPFTQTVADFATQSDFGGNPLPFSSDKPRTGRHKLSWPEYLWEKAPIPVADAAKEVYNGMTQNGMNKTQAKDWWNGLQAMVEAGTTGFRISDSYNKPEYWNDEDKKAPEFNYWIKRGMSLPEVSNSNVNIPLSREGKIVKLSTLPEEKQSQYTQLHKNNLKKILGGLERRSFVYKNKYGEISMDYTGENGQKSVPIATLSKDEQAQVLSLAQKQATKETTKKLYPK